MSAVISKSTGGSSVAFADEYLFSPLAITDYAWEYMPARPEYAGGKLHMRPRDVLKFGLLFVNHGNWKGNQLISADWVAESTQPDVAIPTERNGVKYGYYWWYTSWNIGDREIRACYANENGGQLLYVIEELNMVVLVTGGAYNTGAETKLNSLMRNNILPAVLDL